MTTLEDTAGSYPYQVPIDAYGNGGFRFADMSHKGSLLCLPSGIKAWDVTARPEALGVKDFTAVLKEADMIDVVLLGTGAVHTLPSAELRAAFLEAGIGIEAMTTGSAARTYNILLGERRKVAAALLVVA
ncbi:MAG: Mth938-like domain-containing protein [Hyphomicrobiaceae bacterium]